MRRTEPPDGLRGRAALTSELVASGVARSRLRHADVSRPHRGVAGFGVPDRDVLDRCAAYEPIMLPGPPIVMQATSTMRSHSGGTPGQASTATQQAQIAPIVARVMLLRRSG